MMPSHNIILTNFNRSFDTYPDVEPAAIYSDWYNKRDKIFNGMMFCLLGKITNLRFQLSKLD
jgi:hypothetical protein